jgi:hypothetical protein
MTAPITHEHVPRLFSTQGPAVFVAKLLALHRLLRQQKGQPLLSEKLPFFYPGIGKLNHSDIHGSRTFLPLLYVKADAVAFTEGFKAGGVNRRMMNKHIRPVFPFNESEPFSVVKPFNGSIGHDNILLSKKFSMLQTGGCHFDKWIAPAERNCPTD